MGMRAGLVKLCTPLLWLGLAGLAPAAPATLPADLPIDTAQETALLKAAGNAYQIRRTPHFLIAHRADRQLLEAFAARIEETYKSVYRFCDINKIESRRPDHRLEVIFFNDRRAYDTYSAGFSFPSAGTYGVYYEPTNRSAFFNIINDPQMVQLHADIVAAQASLDGLIQSVKNIRDARTRIQIQYRDGRTATLTKPQAEKEIESARRELKTLDAQRNSYSDRINRTVIQHEVAHQILFNAGVHVRGASNPKWLVEGLACMFETPPEAEGAGIATINQLRLQDFRAAVAGNSQKRRLTPADFLDAVAAGRIVAPEVLIGDPNVFDERGTRGAGNYAAAWALTHYLQRTRTEQLSAYLKEVGTRERGDDPTPKQELAVFEKHFGRLDQTFLTKWSDYILKLGVRSIGGGL